MKKFGLISKYHDAHIEGYACLFFILALLKPLFFLVLIVYIVLLFKKIRIKLLSCLFIVILMLFVYINLNNFPQILNDNVRVVNVEKKLYNNEITVKHGFNKYVFTTTQNIKNDSLIYLEAVTTNFQPQKIHFGFNEHNYYLKKGIKARLIVSNIKVISEKQTLKNYVLNNISNLKIKPYIKMFLFNISTDLDTDLYNKLNILFLFKVSGLHLYSLVTIISRFLKKYEFNKTAHYTSVGIYAGFFYLSNFNYSILRLLLITLLNKVNQDKNYQFTHLDLIQSTFFIILLINPYLIYEIGFLILYLILNLLYLLTPLYKGLNKSIVVTLTTQVITLPFFPALNFFVILLMPILVLLVSGPLFLLTLFTLIIPKLDNVSFYIFTKFNEILKIIDYISAPFLLPKLTYALIFVYFLLWFLLLLSKNNYKKILYFSYLIVLFYLPTIKSNLQTNVYFLSVGQGDSIYLESGSYNIMIDTFNGSLDFLINKGIKELDYLFLTHPDEDHIKEALLITNTIKVNNVGLSAYESYPCYYYNERRYKAFDKINLGPFYIEILGPLRNYYNSNENSLVLKITIKGYQFLFTGDIESEAERDLYNKANLKADVLKVAHHGSKTSSDEDFIKKVNPNYAVISLGYNNQFGFPSSEVIKTLQKYKVKIYRTDLDYTVIFNYSFYYNKWSVKLPFKKEIWYNIILDEVCA